MLKDDMNPFPFLKRVEGRGGLKLAALLFASLQKVIKGNEVFKYLYSSIPLKAYKIHKE